MVELRHVANEHWRAAYRFLIDTVGGEWRSFGGVDAFRSARVRHSFVNGCLVLRSAAADDLVAAIEWLNGGDGDYRVRIDLAAATPELMAVPQRLGLDGDESWRGPGMVLSVLPDAPDARPAIVTARVDAELAPELPAMLAEIDSPHYNFLATLAQPAVDNDRLAIYVGYLGGRLAGTSAVVRTGDSCGVYAVGTADWAQRRGVGSAVSWATLEHARRWGCSSAVLQSSPVGVYLYESMGFRRVTEYQLFDRPRAQPRAAQATQ